LPVGGCGGRWRRGTRVDTAVRQLLGLDHTEQYQRAADHLRLRNILTQNLRWALRDPLGFNPYGNGVFGLPTGGTAALTLAAYRPDQFRYAGSYSGHLNISVRPVCGEGPRPALLDAGTAVGVRNWPYWADQVCKMLPDLSSNLG
jgi:S-formylglutathione hydrolase FrmB